MFFLLQFLPFCKPKPELFTSPGSFVELARWAYAKTGCHPVAGAWRDGDKGLCSWTATVAAWRHGRN